LAKSEHDFGCVGLESRGELPKSLGDTREGVDESESPEVRTARGDFDESKAAEVRPALSPTLDSLIQEQALHKTIKIS